MSSQKKAESLSPESEASRSTARPPAEEGAAESPAEIDLSAAVRAAKDNPSPNRYGPPAATAKIRPFQLAEALAKLSAEVDPASVPPPLDTEPPRGERHDVAALPPSIEIPPADLAALGARNPLNTTAPPPAVTTSTTVPPATVSAPLGYGENERVTIVGDAKPEPSIPLAADTFDKGWTPEAPAAVPPDEPSDAAPAAEATEPLATPPTDEKRVIRTPRPFSPGMIVMLLLGFAGLVYAYFVSNR